jgi:8-oxo-dGTP pyrophosphatase MutT (NUDIX family)
VPRKLPPTFPDDPKPWKVRKREYLSREFWYTVRVDEVELPTGSIIEKYWVNEYRPWVNVVAITARDEVVLIRQYRHGLEQVHFEIPAGTTDPGETELEPAARRELLEETGYGGGRWSLLITLSANPALQDNLAHTFLAEGVERLAEPHTEAGEDLRVHLVPVAEIEGMIDDGAFIQALHTAPLMKYLLARRPREGVR